MNQGKLEVVIKEIARVNIDVLGTTELRWMGMVEFNSDDLLYVLHGEESLRRSGVPLIVNKRALNAILGCKSRFQGKPFNITVIQVYAPTRNTEEAEVEWFYEDLEDLLELKPPKMFFSSQETGMKNEAGQRLIEFCQENTLVITNSLFQ